MTHDHDPLDFHHEFGLLSLADLLLARELNHVELMRRPNVSGTAVGLYLIRKERSRGARSPPERTSRATPAADAGNSEVRPIPGRAILVFVEARGEGIARARTGGAGPVVAGPRRAAKGAGLRRLWRRPAGRSETPSVRWCIRAPESAAASR